MKKGKSSCNGQEIYWESHGKGAPLILVMGIGYDSTLWGIHQTPFFSKHFQTIVFDNRDTGQSSRVAGSYTIADMAEDMVCLMDDLEIQQANLLGISMGGMICQEFAIRYPNRLKSLILTGTGAATAKTKFDPISTWSFVKQHDTGGMEFAAQQFLWLFSNSFLRNHDAVDQTLQMLASNPNPVDAEAYGRLADAYIQHDVLDKLDQIKAPTLIISGQQDLLTPPWICKELASGIKNATFLLLEGDGSSHVLPLERPEDFNKAALEFLLS